MYDLPKGVIFKAKFQGTPLFDVYISQKEVKVKVNWVLHLKVVVLYYMLMTF